MRVRRTQNFKENMEVYAKQFGFIFNSSKTKVDEYCFILRSNDDVICSHGAASGKPDENVLFYLTSRGISRKEAEKVYTQGFLGEFVDKIDNAQMKAKAKQFISQNS